MKKNYDMKKSILGCIAISIKKGYLIKVCEVLYGESSSKPGGSLGHGDIMLLHLNIFLVKK